MQTQHDAWIKSAVHRNIDCVKCHLPYSDPVTHLFWKGYDGIKDVIFFYGRLYGDRIETSGHGVNTIQKNCVRCHHNMVSMMDTGSRNCWSCHRRMNHNFPAAGNEIFISMEAVGMLPENHRELGPACIDCHMPYTRSGSVKYSDHDVTSPLKKDMHACMQCHTESADWLREQVIVIQDRTTSLLIRAGYAAAVTAKLFEKAHMLIEEGAEFDKSLYQKAKQMYQYAFLRVVFVSAENSAGFHNPTEAARILGDAIAFAQKSEGLLRQVLASQGSYVPEFVDLELLKYLNNRGDKNLMFKEDQKFPDPYGLQKYFSQVPQKEIK